MKKRNLNILSIILTIVIVSTFIVPFTGNPIQSLVHAKGESGLDSSHRIRLGISELNDIDNNKVDSDSGESPEASLGDSGIEITPPASLPEDPNGIEKTDDFPLGMSFAMMPYANIGYASNFTELKTLIEENNGIDYIKMTADIAITSVITVPAVKTSLTIDGLNEGGSQNFTLKENMLAVGSTGSNIVANNTSVTHVELKNMEIDGYNYYGTVYGGDRANVTLRYDNVIYDGPQMTYAKLGNAHYNNVTATIRGSSTMETGILQLKPGAAYSQEFAEAGNITFEGNINIQTASNNDSIWWTGVAGANLTFMPATNATITSYAKNTASGGYFVYAATVDTISFGAGADVTFTLPSGFAYNTSMTIGSFQINDSASVGLNMTGTYANAGRGIRTSAFTAELNSNFFLTTKAAPLTILSGGTLTINDPERFLATTEATNASPIGVAGSVAVNINAQTVNLWSRPNGFVDSITNMPDNMFNKATTQERVTLSWTQSQTAASNFSHNIALHDDYYISVPTDFIVNLSTKRTIALGQHNLSVTGVNPVTNMLSGTATPNASLRLEYLTGGQPYTTYFGADGNGYFEVEFPRTVDAGTTPLVIEHFNYLKAGKAVKDMSVLSLEHVPKIVNFGSQKIPTTVTNVKWPNETADPWISVLDTREVGSTWKLTVSAAPLKGTWNSVDYELPKALLFVKDGQEIPITTVQQLVHTGSRGDAVQTFPWDNQNGIFLSIDPGSVKPTSYTTAIDWALEDTP